MEVVGNQLKGSTHKFDGWTQTNQTASEITAYASQHVMGKMRSDGMEEIDELDIAEATQTGYTQVFNKEEGPTVASSNTTEYYELAAMKETNLKFE